MDSFYNNILENRRSVSYNEPETRRPVYGAVGVTNRSHRCDSNGPFVGIWRRQLPLYIYGLFYEVHEPLSIYRNVRFFF